MDRTYRDIAAKNLLQYNIDKLIILGGDGSFRGMDLFSKENNIYCCGVPSTIDNDIYGTDYCLGVDTALNQIKDAIDSVRDTASSFKRAFVVETMGRACGYLALVSSITSGAEMCLIPEIEYDLNKYEERFKRQLKNGRSYFIAVISEGIKHDTSEIVSWFEEKIGIESRSIILGHMQRGGNPTIYDRLMAYKFINYAIDGILDGKKDSVICYNTKGFEYKSISEVTGNKYELNKELLKLTKSIL